MKKQMHRRYTTQEWICLAQERWKEKYDYSKVIYVTKDVEVIIGCPECGFKPIKPSAHLSKAKSNNGCPFCGKKRQRMKTLELNRNKRKTQKQVIRQFEEKHGNRYDYSEVKYVHSHQHVIVICRVYGHGKNGDGRFLIAPHSHISGTGCSDCYKDSITKDWKNHRTGKLTVVERADKDNLGISDSDAYWWVKCACGRPKFTIGAQELQKVKACNVCAQRDRVLRRNKKYWEKIKNKTFGRLTIIRDWGTNKHSARKVMCICKCSNSHSRSHIALSNLLLLGHTSSCGCISKGKDNYLYFIKHEEWASSDCYFYIADIDDNYLKPGITNKLRKRQTEEKYRGYELKKKFCRCEAWVIEQIILAESMQAYEYDFPEKYLDRNCLTEYRKREIYEIYFYRKKFNHLYENLQKFNWADLYLQYFSTDGVYFKN